MNTNGITGKPALFHIEGPDGDETARELFDLLRAEFGVRPERMDRETRRRSDPDGMADPVAVVALIIAIPLAVLLPADPDQNDSVVEKLEKVVAWARDKKDRFPEDRFAVELSDGNVQPLDEISVDKMIEEAAKQLGRS